MPRREYELSTADRSRAGEHGVRHDARQPLVHKMQVDGAAAKCRRMCGDRIAVARLDEDEARGRQVRRWRRREIERTVEQRARPAVADRLEALARMLDARRERRDGRGGRL